MIVISEFELQRSSPPALPQAPGEYQRPYQDQLNNILRLYFIRLQSIVGQFETAEGIIPPTTVYTVATLPSAVTSGTSARAFVSDALAPAFGATVASGGAVATPVYSDGTDWKVG